MSDLIWLSEAQMRRIEPYFPLSHGVLRIPIEAGQGFRREAGHHSGVKPATVPI